MYFYAYWDYSEIARHKFIEVCKEYNYPFTCVDCESKEGVDMSIKYGIKMCPRVGIFFKGKLVQVVNGRCAAKYIRKHTVKNGDKYFLSWENEKKG